MVVILAGVVAILAGASILLLQGWSLASGISGSISAPARADESAVRLNPPAPVNPPAPANPPAPVSGFPDGSNTGVPAGTALTRYSGPCTITSPVTINAVDARSCEALFIRSEGVVITNSMLPRIDAGDYGGISVSITDSFVDGGRYVHGAIVGVNITAVRVNVVGAHHSFQCWDDCTLIDSWLHGQYMPPGATTHHDGFLSNGGSNMVVRGNTIHCDVQSNSAGGGCTADLALIGDFDPHNNVLIERNLFKANNSGASYCVYGGFDPGKPHGVATNVRFVDNVFERGPNRKCGLYGPATDFNTAAPGNVWSGNRWNDGTTLPPP